jgi:hypothetical protein
MGIDVDWHDAEETIIVWKFESTWTWDDYHDAVAAGERMGNSKPNMRIDQIMDLTGNRTFPRNIAKNIQQGQTKEDPNRDYVIVIVGNHLVKGIVDLVRTFSNKHGAHYLSARTVTEARTLIAQRRGEALERVHQA